MWKITTTWSDHCTNVFSTPNEKEAMTLYTTGVGRGPKMWVATLVRQTLHDPDGKLIFEYERVASLKADAAVEK